MITWCLHTAHRMHSQTSELTKTHLPGIKAFVINSLSLLHKAEAGHVKAASHCAGSGTCKLSPLFVGNLKSPTESTETAMVSPRRTTVCVCVSKQ